MDNKQMASLKRRDEIIRWGKRIACNGSSTATSYMKMNKRASVECWRGGSFFFRQLFWKIRSKVKQYYLKRKQQGNPVLFRYDAQSYAQNFDSGRRSFDHRWPFAP